MSFCRKIGFYFYELSCEAVRVFSVCFSSFVKQSNSIIRIFVVVTCGVKSERYLISRGTGSHCWHSTGVVGAGLVSGFCAFEV